MKKNPEEARKLIEGLVSIMSDEHSNQSNLFWLRLDQFGCAYVVSVLSHLLFVQRWRKLQASSKGNYSITLLVTELTISTGVQSRFAASMAAYCEAIMQQVHLQSNAGLTSTVEGLLALRRDSIATTPIYALIEWAISSWFGCGFLWRNLDMPMGLNCQMRWLNTRVFSKLK